MMTMKNLLSFKSLSLNLGWYLVYIVYKDKEIDFNFYMNFLHQLQTNLNTMRFN